MKMETQLTTIHKMEEIIMAENKVKNIGVLTSGGDAPGMNAAIRARADLRRCHVRPQDSE